MTQILDPAGRPVGPVMSAVKKAHDPEEMKRERARLNQVFQNLMQQFVADLSQPQDFPATVEAHVDAVKDHYDAKWRETARLVNESSMPLNANEDLMRTEMDRFTEELRLQKLASTTLSRVADLAEYHLLPLMQTRHGMLYLNSRVAVAVDGDGNNTVWMRATNEPLDRWCSGWAPQPVREPLVEAANYTLGELNNLLAITRRPDVTPLNEHWMAMARTPEAPRKPWYQRIL